MLSLKKKMYIKNKLYNSIKIKKALKYIMLRSIIQNNKINLSQKACWIIKFKFYSKNLTKKSNICLNSSKYNSLNKYTNFNRHEFHKLCRSNKLSNWIVNSW